MKLLKLLFIVCSVLLVNNAIAQDLVCSMDHNHDDVGRSFDKVQDNKQTVYICTGAYAYAYHSRSNCPGLSNCRGSVKYTNENHAANELDRVPCCRCWTNVAGRCKDDNPNYRSGGSASGDNSQAYGYVVIAIVAASAIILSNDVYVYPTYSFHKGRNKQNSRYDDGFGWTFGFRKTFKKSALEYGASYVNSSKVYNNNTRWGGHLNYIHHVFPSKTPKWLKVYGGPSLNYVSDFGYGGIVGTKMKIVDRLNFDVRYEYTTQTNQIQAGLIITYQKKYFWKK
jgi:hypothetical protein